MPFTRKQLRLFKAIEMGWKPPEGSPIHITKQAAGKMAAEGEAMSAVGGFAKSRRRGARMKRQRHA